MLALAVIDQGATNVVSKAVPNELANGLPRLINSHAMQVQLGIHRVFTEAQIFVDAVLDTGTLEIENIVGIDRMDVVAARHATAFDCLGDCCLAASFHPWGTNRRILGERDAGWGFDGLDLAHGLTK